MRDHIIFNGISSERFGMIIRGAASYSAPARKTEKIEIPGRNGALHFDDDTFDNVEVIYPAGISRTLIQQVESVRQWLLAPRGYQRLEDSYHPGEFRLARYASGFELATTSIGNRTGTFSLTFDAKPQRFMKTGEVAVGNNILVQNPTMFRALPIYTVKVKPRSSGLFSLRDARNVDVATVQIDNASETGNLTVYIDTENGQSYGQDGQKLNSRVVIDGSLTIKGEEYRKVVSGNANTTVTFKPRWWRI